MQAFTSIQMWNVMREKCFTTQKQTAHRMLFSASLDDKKWKKKHSNARCFQRYPTRNISIRLIFWPMKFNAAPTFVRLFTCRAIRSLLSSIGRESGALLMCARHAVIIKIYWTFESSVSMHTTFDRFLANVCDDCWLRNICFIPIMTQSF